MIISVFSSLFSIIVAFWAFSIPDFWLSLIRGNKRFFKILTSKIRLRLICGGVLYVGKYGKKNDNIIIFYDVKKPQKQFPIDKGGASIWPAYNNPDVVV